jgi:hypothetical protein
MVTKPHSPEDGQFSFAQALPIASTTMAQQNNKH